MKCKNCNKQTKTTKHKVKLYMLHKWMNFNKNNKNNISSLKLEHRFKTSCCVKSAWEIANTSNFTTGSWPENHATIHVCSITDQQTHQLIYLLVIWNSDHKNISCDTAGSINSSAAYQRKKPRPSGHKRQNMCVWFCVAVSVHLCTQYAMSVPLLLLLLWGA